MLWPKVAGQSGTAIAASYVVTRAPKESSSAVVATSIHATIASPLTVDRAVDGEPMGALAMDGVKLGRGIDQAWAAAAAAASAGWGGSVCMR